MSIADADADTGGGWRADLHTVEYDWEHTAALADDHHRPEVARALRTGRARIAPSPGGPFIRDWGRVRAAARCNRAARVHLAEIVAGSGLMP